MRERPSMKRPKGQVAWHQRSWKFQKLFLTTRWRCPKGLAHYPYALALHASPVVPSTWLVANMELREGGFGADLGCSSQHLAWPLLFNVLGETLLRASSLPASPFMSKNGPLTSSPQRHAWLISKSLPHPIFFSSELDSPILINYYFYKAYHVF